MMIFGPLAYTPNQAFTFPATNTAAASSGGGGGTSSGKCLWGYLFRHSIGYLR